MAEAKKWELCILCQKETEEHLVCPLVNPVASHRVGAHKEIINLMSQFRAIGASPHPDGGWWMKSRCSRIVHPGTNHATSFTGHQHLSTQKNALCLLQREDPLGLENLLTAVYVSSVLKKQMQ